MRGGTGLRQSIYADIDKENVGASFREAPTFSLLLLNFTALFSERPLDGDTARNALALALPSIEVQVIAHAAALRRKALAACEQRTAALQ